MFGLVCSTLIFMSSFDAYAQLPLPGQVGVPNNSIELSGKSVAQKVIGNNTGLSALNYLVFNTGYRIVRELLGIVAIVLVFYFGITMITSNNNEDRISKSRKGLLLVVVGLAFVSVAQFVASQVIVLTGGTFLGDQQLISSTEKFNLQAQAITTFIRYILQGFAIFFVVRSGIALIVAGQESDVLENTKKSFLWSVVAFVLIMIAEPLINNVFFPVDKQVIANAHITLGAEQIQQGSSIIVQIINMLLAFAGTLAVFSLISGAVLYVMALGSQESTDRGKTIIIGSLTGLVIIYSAYTIVAEFVK